MQLASPIRAALILSVLALLAACGEVRQAPPAVVIDPDSRRAAELLSQGQYGAASELYRQMAARHPDPEVRAGFLLAAAEAARDAGDWDSTRDLLEQLGELPATVDIGLQARLLLAELLLHERQATGALAVLDGLSDDQPPPVKMRILRNRASAYRQLGNLLETANSLQSLDRLETDPEARRLNQVEILKTLSLLNEQALNNLQSSASATGAGWMRLASIIKRYRADTDQLPLMLQEWHSRHPDHPALREVIAEFTSQWQDQLSSADQIAIMLPETGNLAGVAAAIRNGIMVSLLELPAAQRPTLRFYDASDINRTWPLYNQAVADGAKLVIGPLEKEAVSQLLRAGDLPVPVLALNQVDLLVAPQPQLFMFALSPEDEARQAAERIWLDGLRRPIVLTPQGQWGDRLAAAFTARWQSLGGAAPPVGQYDASAHDHAETLIRALGLDTSRARWRELQTWLGGTLEFEPRRRADIDAVFMGAQPTQAQGIRPQLQFHHAADLPLYATSHAWLGSLTPGQLEDMRGIILAEIPWLLDQSEQDSALRAKVAEQLPNSASGFARLYAMGMDALHLAAHLHRLQFSPYETLDGRTGTLYMDTNNQILRQLLWIRLDAPPQVLGYSPRLDLHEPAVSVGHASTLQMVPRTE